jgi:hypothetical protein
MPADVFTLADLLAVEDDPAIVDVTCGVTGLPLWPQIRVAFLRMAMSDLVYKAALTGKSATPPRKSRAVITLARSAARNWLGTAGQRADVCITGGGGADQLIDGLWFNRLSDYFAETCPDRTLVIADHFEWRWAFPRRIERTMLHAPQQARNTIVGTLLATGSDRRQAAHLVAIVSGRARDRFGWQPGAERTAVLVQMLARKSAALPSQYHAYRRLLDRVRPKVLMVLGGCYGPFAALIAAAKDSGIVTAEYQHGAVSGGHDGYNFAPAVRGSEAYRRTLPDWFLSYGSWWSEQINAPVGKLALGNPHREAQLASLKKRTGAKDDLLILSDGIDFPLYAALARDVEPAARRLGLRVVLRPHPLERTEVLSRHGTAMDAVAVDGNADLYTSLASAHTVVSEVSTGLFEAVGLADRILMWDTPKSRFGYPVLPFDTFDNAAALISHLADDRIGRWPTDHAVTIWAPGWRGNYMDFLDSHAA